MSLKQISKSNFYSYNVKVDPTASSLGNETSWFSDDENNLLATLIIDNYDKDWTLIIFALDNDGEYRAVDLKVSLKSEEHAEHELILRMASFAEMGQVEEKLYVNQSNKESYLITNIDAEVKKYFKKYPEKLYELSSRKFEELVADILKDFGFNVELTKATRDGGSDVIASIENAVTSFLVLVECKKYSQDNKVGVGIIREVIGVHTLKQPSKSIIVTTSFFSKDAINEAGSFKERIELKDYNSLKGWLNKY
ncbi:MAG TPA: restriction endonuclease [Saprospiraceae bacterium]|nr:restriction endonuclease [Saprospiraceae bacterium]